MASKDDSGVQLHLLRGGECTEIYFIVLFLLVRMLCLGCILLMDRRAGHCHDASSSSFNDTEWLAQSHKGRNALRLGTDLHHDRVARDINNLSFKQAGEFCDSTQMVKRVAKSSGWCLLGSLHGCGQC